MDVPDVKTKEPVKKQEDIENPETEPTAE